MKVREIMSRPVITVAPDSSIEAAAELLVAHSISSLPVLDARGALVGIVSEADLAPIARASWTLSPVAGVMTREVLSIRAESEVSQAARTMLDTGVKRAPVVRGRKVVGIVSRRDLVRVMARQHEAESEPEVRVTSP